MTEPTDPNGQTQNLGNGQTDDWKSQYLDLSAKIANGEYVAKNVYTGLQTKHEKEVLAHKADVDALTAANAKATEFEASLKTLQSQFDETKTKYETAAKDLTVEQTRNQRLNLIMAEFPDLVSFEGKGLLPTAASTDELKTKLSAFQETIGLTRKQQQQQDISGTSPTPGQKNNGENPTGAQILEKARAAQRAGKFQEYNQLMDEYYKLAK